MNYTYALIDGGYEILRNGKVIVRQPLSPNFNKILTEEEAKNIATYLIDKMEKGKFPLLSLEEEIAFL